MLKIIKQLLNVKSIVTIILTIVFAIMCLHGETNDNFMTIYVMIVAFYFGQQTSEDTLARLIENVDNSVENVDNVESVDNNE